MEKKKEIYDYVSKNINIYFRPMLDDIVAKRPTDM